MSEMMLRALCRIRMGMRREDGQTLAEYGILITVISVAVVALALVLFREALGATFQSVVPCLQGSC